MGPDPPRRVGQAGAERLLPARLHLGRRAAGPDQHDHHDGARVQLRPQRERHVVQRRGL